MTYEQKPNTGSLFVNKDRASDTQANAKGSAIIDGVAYWVDAWTNTDRNGNKYQSLKFKRKEQRQEQAAPPKRRSYAEASRGPDDLADLDSMYGHGEDDGEIPF